MKKYSWWDDPKNKEEVERISWWNHSENKEDYQFPISVIQSGDVWVASFNDETELLMGDKLSGCAQGDTKADAIKKLFMIVRLTHEYSDECRIKYQRWVPFRTGQWSGIGSRWVTIFGLHVSFKYGNGMKGGWYIPFTKLNISFSSEWKTYSRYKKKNKTPWKQLSQYWQYF